jgi:carbamoyltransferase
MLVLGISCGHDANVCVLDGSRILIHLEKERFTRKRHDAGDVDDLIRIALDSLGLTLGDIDLVASSIPVWQDYGVSGRLLSGKLYESIFEHSEHVVELLGRRLPAVYVPHHVGHMAYSYYLSGFDSADLIAVDGYGNFTATAIGVSEGAKVRAVFHVPSSVGALWSIVSKYVFGSLLDAGKTMGLAPYGKPRYVEVLKRNYHRYSEDGFPVLDDPWKDMDRIPVLSEITDRSDPMRQEFADMAASIQSLTNEIMVEYARLTRERLGNRKLCLSGGVALNGIANSLIEKSGLYEDVFIGPATNDGGLSIGFAAYALHHVLGHPKPVYDECVYLGKSYDKNDLYEALAQFDNGLVVEEFSPDGLARATARAIADGKIVAWYQGRAESGPRALGHRSILCHPGLPGAKERLNERVKHRHAFRPFAPSVLDESRRRYFDLNSASPYMLKVVGVNAEVRDSVSAVVHVDGTSRPQTVALNGGDSSFRKLIDEFGRIAGIPVLLNTSFNTRGEPIVETPRDALRTFSGCELDTLAIMDCLITKKGER